MTKAVHLCLSVMFGLLLNLGAIEDAEAKRMGGGSSFGSRPSYSAPYKRQATPAQVSPARQHLPRKKIFCSPAASSFFMANSGLVCR